MTRRWISSRRLSFGRERPWLQVYWEPADMWIGAYFAEQFVFVCPIPFLVLRWHVRRGWPAVATAVSTLAASWGLIALMIVFPFLLIVAGLLAFVSYWWLVSS